MMKQMMFARYYTLCVAVSMLLFFGGMPFFCFAEEIIYHASYPSATRERIDEAYRVALPPPTVADPVRAVIVNHHLLAPELIARVMRSVESERIKRVILISPDHFSAGTKRISTSPRAWHTPYGDLAADAPFIEMLARAGVANNDPAPFSGEHGISGIVPFVKKSFPHSSIVPIIIKDTARDRAIDALARYLAEHTADDTVVIGSFDFSHYLPLQIADFHDQKSLEVIRNFDYEGMRVLDIDSRTGLRVVTKFAQQRGARSFELFDHTNSARVTGRLDVTDTTSYINGVFTAMPPSADTAVTLLALGDIMLDRGVRMAMDTHGAGYPFKKIERFLAGSDILVANLEGPITDNTPRSVAAHSFTFTFSPSVVALLKRLGFSLFSLANNHTLNFGKKGLSHTKSYLKEGKIDYFGDPQNTQDTSKVVDVRGVRIGFIGFHGLVSGGKPTIIKEIKKIRESTDTVIVYPHWGNEYQPFFSKRQQEDAHAFIDAGADIVIGAHPHVIQPMEVYKGRAIFYSLGNFVFDQTFSKETQQGLAVGIIITKDRYSFTIVPIMSVALQARIMSTAKKKNLLAWLARKSETAKELKKQIENGSMVLLRN
ncbi:AmmeMemoRadiSam system protein B [Candidatus Uhrbacteria bacterium]|nr:AmmeMemoRadiSam system protein B [Candidatus Uhrbacteria bacterium]